MAQHGDSHDDSGLPSLLLGLVVLVGLSALPGTIGWIRVFAG